MKAFLLIFYFISRRTNLKKLKVLLPDSFLSEIDFTLKDEKILLSDFHYLDFLIENPLKLNNLHVELIQT